MKETVLALYDDLETARAAVQDLVAAGFNRSDIGLAARDPDGDGARYVEGEDVTGEEGAGFGAAVGGLTGLVAGLVAITVPGVGPIIAAGLLMAVLGGAAGAAVGAAAGAVTGGITASLIDLGIDEEYADYYAESVRRGGALVTVSVEETQASQAMDILRRHNPYDVEERAFQWRKQGWKSFDPKSDPYTAVDLAEERSRYSTKDWEKTAEEDNRVRRYTTMH